MNVHKSGIEKYAFLRGKKGIKKLATSHRSMFLYTFAESFTS